jgi:hypothetical protein
VSQDDAPRRSGDAWVLARGLISNTETPHVGTVLNWAGVNFVPQIPIGTPVSPITPPGFPEFCRHESEVAGVVCLRTLDSHGECPVHGEAIT